MELAYLAVVKIYSSYRAMVTSDGYAEDPTPRAEDEPTLKAGDFGKMKSSSLEEEQKQSDSVASAEQSQESNDEDDSSSEEGDEGVPSSSFHGVLPGSVMAAYLTDPVVNPAAQSLYAMNAVRARSIYPNEFDSPRPRAADQVPTLRQPPHLVDEKSRNCNYSSTPSTSNFISLVTDFEATLAHPSCCMVNVLTALCFSHFALVPVLISCSPGNSVHCEKDIFRHFRTVLCNITANLRIRKLVEPLLLFMRFFFFVRVISVAIELVVDSAQLVERSFFQRRCSTPSVLFVTWRRGELSEDMLVGGKIPVFFPVSTKFGHSPPL